MRIFCQIFHTLGPPNNVVMASLNAKITKNGA
jgi:hypothetical protein